MHATVAAAADASYFAMSELIVAAVFVGATVLGALAWAVQPLAARVGPARLLRALERALGRSATFTVVPLAARTWTSRGTVVSLAQITGGDGGVYFTLRPAGSKVLLASGVAYSAAGFLERLEEPITADVARRLG